MENSNLLVLVDGSSYLFRAFHGLPKLTSRKGEPTGAIKGVVSMMTKLYDEYKPSHIAIVFDAPGKTFRSDIYADYKAHRPPIDPDLKVQIKPLISLLEAMGYPIIQISGVEADDVIGTLAKIAVENNKEVLISTSDKDLTQLIDGNTRLIDTMKMSITDYSNVAQRFKVDALKAEQVIDFLALVGDTADNIPGVPKVGPKTASKWLNEYQTLENLVENKEKIKGKVGENLRDNLETLFLSRELATIKLNVELPKDIEIEKLSMNEVDKELLTSLCQRFDLTKLHAQLLGTEASNQASVVKQKTQSVAQNYQGITTLDEFKKLKETLIKNPQWGFELVTNSTLFLEAELIGISFCLEAGQSYYVPLQHVDIDKQLIVNQVDLASVLIELKQIFESNSKKITYNAKLAFHLLSRYGIDITELKEDVMLASYVYQSTANHQLDKIVERYLQYTMAEPDTILGKGVKQLSPAQLDMDTAISFYGERVDYLFRIADYLSLRVDSMPGLKNIYRDIEMPFLRALTATEKNGTRLDAQKLEQQSAEMAVQINALEEQAFDMAESEFNLNSPKQLQHILFEKLDLPVIKKTPKGQPSTNEEVLQELALNHTLPKLILDNRHLTKLKNTYTDKLPLMINDKTHRLHTTYHQAITSTGRLSSSDPNLQNIPIRSQEGKVIRSAFIASENAKIVAFDYSQIELRIMAHLSKDALLIDAFNNNKDVHTQTAAEIFELPENQVTADHRRKAKAINFGLIYGMSAFGLAKQIGVGRKEAASYIENYFNKYTHVQHYMGDIVDYAKNLGYVETILGRRLYVPDISSSNAIRRNAAERLCVNAPMQGSSADIIKIAMNHVYQKIKHKSQVKLIMQVHDELVFDIPNTLVDEMIPLIQSTMESAIHLSVPLVVDYGVGDNWEEAH